MPSPPSMFNAPSAALESKPDTTYIQPTLNHGLRIWWAYFWPTSLIAGLLQFCAGYWLRVMYERTTIDAHTVKAATLILPYAITAATGLLIFRYLLGKRFRYFRLALLPAGSLSGAAPLRPIWRRTVRVWWTFTWRSVLYTLILSFLIGVSLGWLLGMLSETSRLMAVLVPLIQGLVVGAAVGLFVIYSNVLDEDFSDFRVVLLPREAPASETPVSANLPPQTQPTA
jgi:hypothetical protein